MTQDSTDTSYNYNQTYEKLIEDENDLVGMIAYSLYKENKREWIIEFRSNHSRPPNKDEEKLFVESKTPKDIERYRLQSEQMLTAYAGYILDKSTAEIREKAINESVLSSVNKKIGGFWKQVFAGSVGAFFYSLLLLLIYLIINYIGVDLILKK
ncbi:hypothetical protein K8I31_18390 [bacterium]|nr:hypothetical protein [bacterium]